jgi:DHA2 family multidrug resistance protein
VIFGTIISFTHLALIPLSYNFWQLLALSALGSIGGAISLLASSAMTVEEGRKYGMGSAIAIISMALSLGMTIGPILGGVMVDLVDISAAFYFGAIMALLGAGLFTWFTRYK